MLVRLFKGLCTGFSNPLAIHVIVISMMPCVDPLEIDAIHQHYKDLDRLVTQMEKHDLYGSQLKDKFFQKSVVYLGHVLENGTRRPAPGKITAIEKWDPPKSVKEIRAFLGVCQYYAQCIPHFSKIASPLMDSLTQEALAKQPGVRSKSTQRFIPTGPLTLSPAARKAFEELKKAMSNFVVLKLLDPGKEFILHTDASDFAVGGVLSQKDENEVVRPLAFYSRKLTGKGDGGFDSLGQRKWSVREKETYAIVSCLLHWAPWIGLQKVTLYTDHKCLETRYKESFDNASGPAGRRGRWHEFLSRFDLEVRYIPGKDNVAADAMSRWAYPAGSAEDVTFHGGVQDELDVEGMLEREKELEYQEAYSPLRQVWKEAILLFPDNDDPEDPNNIGDLLDEIASQRVITEGVRPVHDGDPPPTCTKDT